MPKQSPARKLKKLIKQWTPVTSVRRRPKNGFLVTFKAEYSKGMVDSIMYRANFFLPESEHGLTEFIFTEDVLVKCTCCKRDRPRTDFPYFQHKSDGLRKDICNRCNISSNQKRTRNPLKIKARYITYKAIKDGVIPDRPDACEDCGDTEEGLYIHHLDYEKPLEIAWLCGDCHAKRHWSPKRKLKEGMITREQFDQFQQQQPRIPATPVEARQNWLD